MIFLVREKNVLGSSKRENMLNLSNLATVDQVNQKTPIMTGKQGGCTVLQEKWIKNDEVDVNYTIFCQVMWP